MTRADREAVPHTPRERRPPRHLARQADDRGLPRGRRSMCHLGPLGSSTRWSGRALRTAWPRWWNARRAARCSASSATAPGGMTQQQPADSTGPARLQDDDRRQGDRIPDYLASSAPPACPSPSPRRTAHGMCQQREPQRLLRQCLPRRTSLAGLTQRQCDTLAQRLNSPPRKRLEYRTPAECFYAR